MTDGTDRWHRWLLDARFGGDAAHGEKVLTETLYPIRDAVLDKAHLVAGETLLDVGCGDGLISFGALDRLGPAGRVIFTDISQDLLDHCRKAAGAEDVLGQCTFLRGPANDLSVVGDASVDVVTTRSVLIYVKEKAQAMHEFYRVLRPGGRISVSEPINVLMSGVDADRFYGYDITPVKALAAKVEALYESVQPRDTDPMMDFDDRDLVRFAQDAGFPEIGLELHVSVKTQTEAIPWERFTRTSANPLVPSFGDAIAKTLRLDEAAEFTAHLKPLVESGARLERMAIVHLTATKS
jgi:arsenite methyltransferase